MNEMPISEDDVAFFRTHGWWVSPPMLSDEVLDDLQFGIERYLAGERDWLLPINLSNLADTTAVVSQSDYLSLQIREFRQVIEQKPIAATAARLVGTGSIRLFHDQLVTKPPYDAAKGPATVGWHTDKAYWSSCSSANMVTAWIPLEDVPEEKGPLAVWDASHRWPGVEELHSFAVTDLSSIEERFQSRGLKPEIVILPMKRRQVSFHHCRLVHGGFANRTNSPRFGYAIHMQDAENHYLGSTTDGSQRGHINDLLCRRTPAGDPDYQDEEFFPILWP